MENRVAVITGSTSGIGLAVALAFVKQGCSVVVTGLGDTEIINGVLDDLRSNAKPDTKVDFVSADLTDTPSIQNFCLEVEKLYPGIDIIVNNAGFQHISLVEDFPLDVWQKMLTIQLTASFMLIKHFLPKMKTKDSNKLVAHRAEGIGFLVAQEHPLYTALSIAVGLSIEVGRREASFHGQALVGTDYSHS